MFCSQTFLWRHQIRQRKLLSHMTKVIVHVGKARTISLMRFCPVLLLCLPFSVLPSLFFSLCCCVLPTCAHSSLAHSLSASLFNGGHEKKAGMREFCGTTDRSRCFSLTLATLGWLQMQFFPWSQCDGQVITLTCFCLLHGVVSLKPLLPLLYISDGN